MARSQSSELRPAVPFLHLGEFEKALEGVSFAVSVDGGDLELGETSHHRLTRAEFMGAACRLDIDRGRVARHVAKGLSDLPGLPEDAVSFLCFASSPTLKQTELLHPGAERGKVALRAIGGAEDLPDQILI